MNLRKHLAGFAIFSFILGSAIFINHFLTIPNVTIPSAPPRLPFSEMKERPQPIKYLVEQVSLDFAQKKSYTQLSLELKPGQTTPERLWVTTFYFSSDSAPGRVWTSQTEVRQPFAGRNRIGLVTTARCELCSSSDMPRAGYFARVYVSTEYTDNAYPPDVRFNHDITTAVPVVVHWPDDNRQTADTMEKFIRAEYFIY